MNIELNSVKFDEQGLIPVIVQDVLSGGGPHDGVGEPRVSGNDRLDG